MKIANFALPMKRIVYILLLCAVFTSAKALPEAEHADTVLMQEVEVVAIKANGTTLPDAVAATVIGRKEAEQLNIQALKGLSDVVPNIFVPDYC